MPFQASTLTLVSSPFPRPSGANRRLAVQVLLHGPISRGELAHHLNRSTASVSRLAKPLVDSGLLIEREPIIQGRSRPQVPLDVDPDRVHVVGVNVARGMVTMALTNLRGRPREVRQIPVDSTTPDAVVTAISTFTRTVSMPPDIAAVGIGGSTMDARTVTNSQLLGWHDVPLAQLVEDHTHIPVIVGNDVECLAFGESWFGSARDCPDFNTVTIGAGIGFCAVRSGTLVRGRDSGLVVGNLPLTDIDGTTACASTFLGGPAMVERYERAGGHPNATALQVLQLDAAADPAAGKACAIRARRLGCLVGTAAAFTLPSLTLITGESADIALRHRDALEEGMRSVRPPDLDLPNVVICRHDRRLWARGAAVLGIRSVLGLEDDTPSTLRDEPML